MHTRSPKNLLAMSASAIAFFSAATPVLAQEAPANGGDQTEILVTANRREETVQDAPIAVTAIPQREIEARGIDNFEGFARSVPGLTLNQPAKNRSVMVIRGITTSVIGGNTQDPVSVYINDTPVTDTYGAIVQPDLRLFDVARIEVLRGPQGTLFGSGSLGGTVRIITNKPDATKFETAGRIDLGTTEDGGGMRQRYDGMVNLPLVEDKLALRVVGYYRHENGWVKNATLGTRNDTIDWGGRASLQWTPTDALTVRAEIFHQDSDPKDGDAYNPALGKFISASPVALGRPSKITNYNLSIDYDIGDFATLTSSTTYQKSNSALVTNLGSLLGPGTPVFVLRADPWNSRFFVQEARLVSNTKSRFQWVAGAFYIDRKTDVPNYNITAAGLNTLFRGALGSDNYFTSSIFTKSTETAGYADASYEVLSGLKIRGGLRVFHTTAGYDERNRVALNFATLRYAPPLSFVSRSSGTHTTWRTGLSYEPSKDILLFANVSKGFRIGQVNPNFGPSAVNAADFVIPQGYEPDSTVNYEAGVKTTWLDGNLTLNLTGFYIDWKNIQINGTRISDRATFITNAGTAKVKGVEFEFTARPFKGLSFYGNTTLQSGEIESVPTNIAVPAAVGDRLPGLARFRIAGGAEYRWPVGAENQIYVRLDAQHTSSSPNAFRNAGANALYAIDQAYSQVDGSIGIDTAWGNVAIYGENLTNDDSVILKNLSATNSFYTLRPRTFGIRLTYRH